jgi:2-polyprenyl-3-methyl-5-hydroxy-6-metoxy-1,4-benzoquinol methylase
MKITRSDVISAYRIFLNREPETEQAISAWLDQDSVSEMRAVFLRSAEYREREKLGSTPSMSGLEARMRSDIDSDIDKLTLAKVFEKVQKVWMQLGKDDPLWAVLSLEKYRNINRSEALQDFYLTGAGDAELIEKTLLRNGISLPENQTVVELGCGVGRVTSHLARKYSNVIGVDISKSMIDEAASHFSTQGIANTSFKLISRVEDFEQLPKCDLLFSLIVLQHSPPPVISMAIRGAIKCLNMGGVALFQVPTYIPNYEFIASDYISSPTEERQLHPSKSYEMHAIRQCDLMKIIDESGGRVLEIYEDDKMGPHYPSSTSNTLLVEKIRSSSV